MKHNKFIVIEGLDGAGKTSAISQVIHVLQKHGIQDIVFTREPGGTPLADALRVLIKSGVNKEPVNKYAELFMLYAARIQLIDGVIKPALARGAWVVSERHDLSSQAYQGGGRCIDKHLLKILRDMVLADFYPDLTLYLDISPELSLNRLRTRRTLDRIELESLAFFNRTRARYQALTKTNDQIITLDASQPLASVHATLCCKLTTWLRLQGVSAP